MTEYQLLILMNIGFINFVGAGGVVFVSWALVRFAGLREAAKEAMQDGDKVFHRSDAKFVSHTIAGWFSAWFTLNIAGAIAYEKMFTVEAGAFIAVFASITFALWGIAWKK